MLKRHVKYTDFDGNKREEDLYFNFTKAEVLELEVSRDGSLKDYMERIIKAEDGRSIVETMKMLILKGYGKKSDDGRRFIKSDELSTEFSQTEAFSDLFMELAMDAEKAAAFINGMMPSDIDEFLAKHKMAGNVVDFPGAT